MKVNIKTMEVVVEGVGPLLMGWAFSKRRYKMIGKHIYVKCRTPWCGTMEKVM